MIFTTLWDNIIQICQTHPEILIFLSLAIGYYIGRVKIFGFSIGSTVGVLLASLILGQLHVSIPPIVKTISFALFIFTVGYSVGPLFFRGFQKNNINLLILTVFFAASAVTTAIILGKIFGFDLGTTAGLLSGSITQSSIIGAAEESIKHLALSVAQKEILISNIALAYAITYIFGFAGIILFYKIAPQLLRIHLKNEAKQLETTLLPKKESENTKHESKTTDLAAIAAGCTIGIAIGLITIKCVGIPLSLGAGGGALFIGLLCGGFRFCHITEESQWLFTNVGLNTFIACIGLTAAPRAIEALKTQGMSLVFAGMILTLTPHILGIIFGRIILKLNYVLLFGALTGTGTMTPAMQILKEESNSSVPALGYTIPYALSNFILTICGTIVVLFMSYTH